MALSSVADASSMLCYCYWQCSVWCCYCGPCTNKHVCKCTWVSLNWLDGTACKSHLPQLLCPTMLFAMACQILTELWTAAIVSSRWWASQIKPAQAVCNGDGLPNLLVIQHALAGCNSYGLPKLLGLEPALAVCKEPPAGCTCLVAIEPSQAVWLHLLML